MQIKHVFSEGKEKPCGLNLFCMKRKEMFFICSQTPTCNVGQEEKEQVKPEKYRLLYSVCAQLDQLQQIA